MAQVKYLDFGSLYTYCCHGSKEHQIRRWLRERIAYVDSMMGYFTSQEDQITIRMNKTGYVSFDITPYIPLYLSVKWSNASNGTQTIKVGRGETATFYYNSTTATDQEILIPYAKHIKKLDNLSNLVPSTCILSNAVKLTNVEIHSPELYNINVTNNKFLRRLDLQDCTALGTVTATGSSLNLSNCKYLQYCNVYNTNLTEVQLNSKGGSLTEIYYPKTIQSIQLIKQRLLETVGLPLDIPKIKTSEVDLMSFNKNQTLRMNLPNPDTLYTFTTEPPLEGAAVNYGNSLSDFIEVENIISVDYYKIGHNTNTTQTCNIFPRIALYDKDRNFIIAYGRKIPTNSETELGLMTSYEIMEQYSNTKYIRISLTNWGEHNNVCYNNWEGFFGDYKICINERNSTATEVSCVCTSLYTVDIQDCPKIKRLNVSEDKDIQESFIAMAYCNNLTLRNSLNLSTLSLDNFYRLAKLTLENMYLLENVNLNNLLLKGGTPTLTYLGFSNCPLLENISFNCTSDEYEITFKNDAVLNFGNLYNLKSITSNCTWKGAKTLILPTKFETLDLTSTYGEDSYSDLINIWSSTVCNVNTDGAVPKATHNNASYSGIDFSNMNVKNINMETLIRVQRAINFNIAPTTINPNFNKNRNGNEYSYFQPSGSIDLSNYEGDFVGFFKGVNIDTLEVICNKSLNQTDFSYCFYEAIINDESFVNDFLFRIVSATNLNYCFYKTSISNISTILNNITIGNNTTMSHTFSECYNLTSLNGITIPNRVVDISNLFENCPITTINNLTINVKGSVKGLFNGCNRLVEVTNLDMPNVTDMSELFKGCIKLTSIVGFNIPNGCTNLSGIFYDCYKLNERPITVIPNSVKDISYMFYNCTDLNDISGMTFGSGIENYTDFLTNSNVEYANNLIVETTKFKFTGNTTIKQCKNYKPARSTTDFNECFKDCTSLEEFTFHTDTTFAYAIQMTSMFENCSNLKYDILLPTETISATYMYRNCTKMTNIHSNWYNTYAYAITHEDCYGGCIKVMYIDDVYVWVSETDIGTMYIPKDWGGMGLTEDTLTILKINTSLGDNSLTIGIRDGNTKYQGIQPTIIDWGDGTIDERSVDDANPSHTYANHGVYTIKFDSSILIKMGNAIAVTGNIKQKVTDILKVGRKARGYDGLVDVTTLEGAFSGYENLKYVNLEGVDKNLVYNASYLFDNISKSTSLEIVTGETPIKISDASYMFRGCTNIPSIDLSGFDFSNCTTLYRAFYNCSSLLSIDLSGHNFTKVTSLYETFYNCRMLTEIIGIDKVYTPKLTDVLCCFQSCSSLTSLNLSGLKPDNAISLGSNPSNAGNRLFGDCTSLRYLDMSNFKFKDYARQQFSACTNLEELIMNNCDFTNVTTFEGYFYEAKATKIYLRNIKVPTAAVSCYSMFYNCSNLEILDITIEGGGSLVLNNVYRMFSGCQNLTSLDVSSFNTSNCTSFESMFEGCKKLASIDISNFDLSKVTKTIYMFKNCTNLQEIIGLETLSAPSLTSIDYMFSGCSSLTRIDLSNMRPNDYVTVNSYNNNGNNESKTFYNCNNLEYLDLSNFKIKGYLYRTFLNLSNLKTIKLNNVVLGDISDNKVDEAFSPSLITIELNNFNIGSSLTNLGYMFSGCQNLISLDVSSFDTSNCTSFQSMFQGCKGLTSIDISNFDLSKATNLNSMFRYCINLQEIIGLETLPAPNLTNMQFMFQECSSLTRIDLSNMRPNDYVYVNATFYNNPNHSFYKCDSLEYLDLSNFKISGTTRSLFEHLTNLKTLKVNNTSTTSTDLTHTFTTSATTVELDNFDASLAENASAMFEGCKATSLDVSTLNILNVMSADNMFSGCTNLTFIDVDLDLSNISQSRYMFSNCTSLKSVDLSKFKFNKNVLTIIDNMFNGCTSLTELDLSPLANENYTRMADMVVNCKSLTKINISNWSNASTTNLDSYQYLFRNADFIRELIAYNCPSGFLTGITTWMSDVTPTDLRIMRNDAYVGISQNKFIEIPSSENYVRAIVDMVRATILKLIGILDVVESGTLSLGSANIGRLTEEDLLLATSKGWVVI